MTNNIKNTINPEQIKNNIPETSCLVDKLKLILDKDEFGYFKGKTRRSLDLKIKETENKLQTLLDLKKRSEDIYKILVQKKKNLILENKKLKESLMEKLEFEVSKWR